MALIYSFFFIKADFSSYEINSGCFRNHNKTNLDIQTTSI